MARFKTVKKEFTSLPNEVIQGFYLSANALAVLITCLSYPNVWEYRPLVIWKSLKISRDKTYLAFDELVEKGHCIRIRHFRGNLRAEVDYIFFDEIKSCQAYLEENKEELNAENIEVTHKWNYTSYVSEKEQDKSNELKKVFRHPEIQHTEGRVPDSQEVLKKIPNKKIINKKNDNLELSIKDDNIKVTCKEPPPDPNPPNDRSSLTLDSIASFNPDTYVLPDGRSLSLRMRRAIAKYTPEERQRLNENVAYFEEAVKSGKDIDNYEAYLQNCINRNYGAKAGRRENNALYAAYLKELHNVRSMEILKTVVRIKRSAREEPDSIDLYLPEETFARILENYINNNIRSIK